MYGLVFSNTDTYYQWISGLTNWSTNFRVYEVARVIIYSVKLDVYIEEKNQYILTKLVLNLCL